MNKKQLNILIIIRICVANYNCAKMPMNHSPVRKDSNSQAITNEFNLNDNIADQGRDNQGSHNNRKLTTVPRKLCSLVTDTQNSNVE